MLKEQEMGIDISVCTHWIKENIKEMKRYIHIYSAVSKIPGAKGGVSLAVSKNFVI